MGWRRFIISGQDHVGWIIFFSTLNLALVPTSCGTSHSRNQRFSGELCRRWRLWSDAFQVVLLVHDLWTEFAVRRRWKELMTWKVYTWPATNVSLCFNTKTGNLRSDGTICWWLTETIRNIADVVKRYSTAKKNSGHGYNFNATGLSIRPYQAVIDTASLTPTIHVKTCWSYFDQSNKERK